MLMIESPVNSPPLLLPEVRGGPGGVAGSVYHPHAAQDVDDLPVLAGDVDGDRWDLRDRGDHRGRQRHDLADHSPGVHAGDLRVALEIRRVVLRMRRKLAPLRLRQPGFEV